MIRNLLVRLKTNTLGGALILALATSALLCEDASSVAQQIGVRVPSLEEYCQLPSVSSRETIVYVDAAAITGKPDRISELVDAVDQKIGLAPRERVRILYATGTDSKEIFNKCWPEFTPDEIAANRAPSTSWSNEVKRLFDQSPEQKLKDTKDFFRQNVQTAINKAAAAGSVDKTDFIRTLSADKSRLGSSRQIYRILIYSPMNSDILRNAFPTAPQNEQNESEQIGKIFRDYPLALGGAEVFIWGVEDDQKVPLRTTERLWAAYLQLGMSNLKSFAPELPIQEIAFIKVPAVFAGTWKSGVSSGRVSMSIASDGNGGLVSSWINFQAGSSYSIPIVGTYQCDSAGACALKGRVDENVPYLSNSPPFEKDDIVELSGNGIQLKGSLKPRVNTVFSGQGPKSIPAEYFLDITKE
jgi:hypothetical protein